jgi:hypothetical protein
VRGELSDSEWRRLRSALALTMSIDAMVVMKDVCRLQKDQEAQEVLRWAASALLRAALAEAGAKKRSTKRT